jgi:hypothetical protein
MLFIQKTHLQKKASFVNHKALQGFFSHLVVKCLTTNCSSTEKFAAKTTQLKLYTTLVEHDKEIIELLIKAILDVLNEIKQQLYILLSH